MSSKTVSSSPTNQTIPYVTVADDRRPVPVADLVGSLWVIMMLAPAAAPLTDSERCLASVQAPPWARYLRSPTFLPGLWRSIGCWAPIPAHRLHQWWPPPHKGHHIHLPFTASSFVGPVPVDDSHGSMAHFQNRFFPATTRPGSATPTPDG